MRRLDDCFEYIIILRRGDGVSPALSTMGEVLRERWFGSLSDTLATFYSIGRASGLLHLALRIHVLRMVTFVQRL